MSPYYEDAWSTIYFGDCFDILHDLSGIGAVITDPPYSSGGAFRGDRAMQTSVKYVNSDTAAYRPEFAGDNRDQRSFVVWCAMWLNAARQASEPGAVLASFIDWRNLPALTDAVQAGGWVWRNLATWHKPGIRMQKGRFSGSAEYVVYATNGPVLDGGGSPQNVYACAPIGGDEGEHERDECHGVGVPDCDPRQRVRWWSSTIRDRGRPIVATATTHPSEQAHPEEHIREESLHKASTDLTAWDVTEGPAPDIWVVKPTILVRADSEDGARAKVAGNLGTWADLRGADVAQATAKDLEVDTSEAEQVAKDKAKAQAEAQKQADAEAKANA